MKEKQMREEAACNGIEQETGQEQQPHAAEQNRKLTA